MGLWLALGLIFFGCGAGSANRHEEPSNDGFSRFDAATNEVFADLNGNRVDPFHVSDAKATVLIFLGTDCPISNRYAPEIQRLHAEFSSKGVAFWLVYPSSDETLETARKHALDYRYAIPALLDPKHQLVRLAKARVTPEAAVFTPDRELVYHGRIDDRNVDFGKERAKPTKRDLQETLEAIVTGKPIAVSSQPAIGCYISNLP